MDGTWMRHGWTLMAHGWEGHGWDIDGAWMALGMFRSCSTGLRIRAERCVSASRIILADTLVTHVRAAGRPKVLGRASGC